MLFGVYSMRDNVSGLYNNPTFENDDNCAKRSFRYAVNNNDFLAFNYSDVDLFKIGEFDNESGKFYPCDPLKLMDGVTAKEK